MKTIPLIIRSNEYLVENSRELTNRANSIVCLGQHSHSAVHTFKKMYPQAKVQYFSLPEDIINTNDRIFNYHTNFKDDTPLNANIILCNLPTVPAIEAVQFLQAVWYHLSADGIVLMSSLDHKAHMSVIKERAFPPNESEFLNVKKAVQLCQFNDYEVELEDI